MASGSTPPISAHDGHCIDGAAPTTVRIRFPPGSTSSDFVWPPLPPVGAAYAFAIEAAVLACGDMNETLPPTPGVMIIDCCNVEW